MLLRKKKKKGNSWSLFLAGNVEVWLLKVAAAAAAAAVAAVAASAAAVVVGGGAGASVLGLSKLFWVTATPCLPEVSPSSVTHPTLTPSVPPSICPSIH